MKRAFVLSFGILLKRKTNSAVVRTKLFFLHRLSSFTWNSLIVGGFLNFIYFVFTKNGKNVFQDVSDTKYTKIPR